MTTVEAIRPQIRRPATLRAFDSTCSTTEVGKVVVGNRLAESKRIKLLGGEVAKGPDADPKRVDELSAQVNEAIYTAVERIYGLSPEDEGPEAYFKRQMALADRTVRFLAEQVNSNDPLLSEPVQEFDSPADVIKHLASPDTDPESRRAVTTRLAFALTSAEQAPYYEGTPEVLSEVDAMITGKIVTQPRTSGLVYTVHDNKTNALDRAAVSLESLFAEPVEDSAHVKAHDLKGDFQHIGETDDPSIGLVAVRSRIKSENTALLKTVRAAILRTEGKQSDGEDLAKGDNLVATDTKDLIGSTYVALDAKDSYDGKVDTLRAKVIAEYKKLYPNLTDADFVDDSKTNKREDSVDFNFQRVLVNNIPGIEGYYEVMFFGQDYFDYKYAIGKPDPDTGNPDGCAHALYEGTRFFKTYDAIFQPEDADAIEKSMYAERSEQLLADNRVDVADLEKEYAELIALHRGGVIFNGERFANTGTVYASA